MRIFIEVLDRIRKLIKSLGRIRIFILVMLMLNSISILFLFNLAIKQYGKIAWLQNQVKTNSITSSINSQLLSNPESDRLEYRVESIERSLSSHGMPPIPKYKSFEEALTAAKEGKDNPRFNKAWANAYAVKEGNNQVSQLIELHKEFKALATWDKKSLSQKLAIMIQQNSKDKK